MAEHESRPIFVKGRPWQAFHNCFHICNFRLGPFAGNFHAKADTKKHDETDPLQCANQQSKPAGKRPSTPDHPAILAFNTPEAQVGSARYLPGPICRRSARSVPKINTPSPRWFSFISPIRKILHQLRHPVFLLGGARFFVNLHKLHTSTVCSEKERPST